jgi:WD40 repeat protein
MRQLKGHTNIVGVVSFHPLERIALTGSNDGEVCLWNLTDGKEMRRFSPGKGVYAAAFSPLGQTVAVTLFDNRVQCWEVATGREWGQTAGLTGRYGLAFSPDGKAILADQKDNSLVLWDPVAGRELQRFRGHQALVKHVAFSSDGRRIASGAFDSTVCLWDAATGAQLQQFSDMQSPVLAVGFTGNDTMLMFGGVDQIRMRDAKSWKPCRSPARLSGSVRHLCFAQDARHFLTIDADEHGRLWQLGTTPALIWRIPGGQQINKVAMSPDGRTALAVEWPRDGAKCSAFLIDTADGRTKGDVMPHPLITQSAVFSNNGQWVLTGSTDGMARLWDAATGKLLQQYGGPLRFVSAVAVFSPDDRLVLTGAKHAQVWRRDSCQPVGSPLECKSPVFAVALSPDGRTALAGCTDGTAEAWDVESGRRLGLTLRHEGGIKVVAFSPDGQMMLTAGADHTARLWNARTGQPVGAPMRHHDWVFAAVFSPDGRTVATGSFDNTARVWDAKSGEPLGTPLRHQNRVQAVGFSPDSRIVITASLDNSARWWDVATSQPIGPPLYHAAQVMHVACSRRSDRAVTGSNDGTARIWRIPEPLGGDAEMIGLDIQLRTGATLDNQGGLKLMNAAAWQQWGTGFPQP